MNLFRILFSKFSRKARPMKSAVAMTSRDRQTYSSVSIVEQKTSTNADDNIYQLLSQHTKPLKKNSS